MHTSIIIQLTFVAY